MSLARVSLTAVSVLKDKTDLALPDWVYERVEGAGIRVVS